MDKETILTMKADLLRKLAELEEEEKKLHEEELRAKRETSERKWNFLQNHAQFLLEHLITNHTGASCCDQYHSNGWNYDTQEVACTRCFFLDLLCDETRRKDFDVKFDVEIIRIN